MCLIELIINMYEDLIHTKVKRERKEDIMKKLFAGALAGIAVLASTAASMGCIFIFADEPCAPHSMMD